MSPFRIALQACCVSILSITAGTPHAVQEPSQEPERHGHSMEQAEGAEFVEANPSLNGRWTTVRSLAMPINPIHAAMMHTGKVLVIAGSGNDAGNPNLRAAIWDPDGGSIRTFKLPWDMFCSGMVILPNGSPFVVGGNKQYENGPGRPWLGLPRAATFDPITEGFTDVANMNGGRWYPTATVLGDGSVMVYSGDNDTDGKKNLAVEIWRRGSWVPAGTAFSDVSWYPRQHLLPSGKIFVSGWQARSQLYDPATGSFTPVAATRLGRHRDYGTSVLLPLTPANGFTPKVMILGGGRPTTETTELIDLSGAPSSWQWVAGPPMVKPRKHLNATLLPNGKVLVSGGGEDGTARYPVLAAQLYDPQTNPQTNAFSSASTMQFRRLYHSNTLLLPDGTVAAIGSNPTLGFEPSIEIYSPPYLFKADGSAASRPAITSLSSPVMLFDREIEVRTPNAADVRTVVLIRPGAPTHAFDMEQRLVGLTFTAGSGLLRVRAPENGNLAPPGYYLLFLVNSRGVPSVGQFVRLSGFTPTPELP